MLRRLIVFDALLVLVLGLGAVTFWNQWKAFGTDHQISAITPEAETFPKSEPAVGPAPGLTTDWTDIPVHNLFSFDRSDILLVATAPAEPPKPPGPKPILFGTIFIGPDKMAMMATAASRVYRPMKVGEVIDGWTITDVLEKAVVIAGNGIQQTVILNDPTAQIPRNELKTTTAAAPAAVIPTATAPAPVSMPVSAAPGSAPKKMRLVEGPLGPRMVEVPD